MKDEKYISIEYETWKTKYLPMEQALKDAKLALRADKDKNTVFVSINDARRFVGALDFGAYAISTSLRTGSGITPEEQEQIESLIHRQIESLIRESSKFMHHREGFVTIAMLSGWEERLRDDMAENIKILESIEQGLLKFPRIIRWFIRRSINRKAKANKI
jgi:hypothetical protein